MSLATHPDRDFANLVVTGIREGFRVGYDYSHTCKKSPKNMQSAREGWTAINEYLAQECAEGRILGPFDEQSLPQLQVSRLGVVPKHTPGQWRLIVDLSSPAGHSVNDGISRSLCSLTYVSVDTAVKLVEQLGRGTLLAKVDIWSAYRIFLFTEMIGGSWECIGRAVCLWTRHSHLGSGQPQRYLRLLPMLSSG